MNLPLYPSGCIPYELYYPPAGRCRLRSRGARAPTSDARRSAERERKWKTERTREHDTCQHTTGTFISNFYRYCCIRQLPPTTNVASQIPRRGAGRVSQWCTRLGAHQIDARTRTYAHAPNEASPRAHSRSYTHVAYTTPLEVTGTHTQCSVHSARRTVRGLSTSRS